MKNATAKYAVDATLGIPMNKRMRSEKQKSNS